MNLAKEWLKAAKDDLILLDNIQNNSSITNLIAFHSQQAIEKSLKATIEFKKIKVPKEHDLLRLKNIIGEFIYIENSDLLDELNELYIDSRYPGEFGLLPYGKPTIEDARKFYIFAQDVFNKVCNTLNINIEDFKC